MAAAAVADSSVCDRQMKPVLTNDAEVPRSEWKRKEEGRETGRKPEVEVFVDSGSARRNHSPMLRVVETIVVLFIFRLTSFANIR